MAGDGLSRKSASRHGGRGLDENGTASLAALTEYIENVRDILLTQSDYLKDWGFFLTPSILRFRSGQRRLRAAPGPRLQGTPLEEGLLR